MPSLEWDVMLPQVILSVSDDASCVCEEKGLRSDNALLITFLPLLWKISANIRAKTFHFLCLSHSIHVVNYC